MRYHVLACDYDGTLAHDGHVDKPTVAALQRLVNSGRRIVLVTGRELPELLAIFPEIHLCACVVAENGALLYFPTTREEKPLATPPPAAFVDRLRAKGVPRISTGRVIVATWRPHENAVLDAIRDLQLELQLIFNKDAVMVLPSGVNKATGLRAGLKTLELSPHEAVGVGDAENDHAFLQLCECGVAVDNALPAVKDHADWTTRGDHGAGVEELIGQLLDNDLASLAPRLRRHDVLLGANAEGNEVLLPAFGMSVLIAGPSGSGKSTAASGILEGIREHRYQFCIIDPEGDYEHLEGAITLGDTQRGPSAEEVMRVLAKPNENVVVNLVGLSVAERPSFFLGLLPKLSEMRARSSRPHWLVLDEAHHLVPASWQPMSELFRAEMQRMLFITVHPAHVARSILEGVKLVLAVGPDPAETLGEFWAASGQKSAPLPHVIDSADEVMAWWQQDRRVERLKLQPPRAERRRHVRKYATGELPPDFSFYFTGPEKKLHLRAQNLSLFLQLADGVDDETWLHHLRHGDYSRWFRERIKDEALAEAAVRLEKDQGLNAADSRQAFHELIKRHYALDSPLAMSLPGTVSER